MTIQEIVDGLMGPGGAMLGAVITVVVLLRVIIYLWREDRRVYQERIADIRSQRDKAFEGWKKQTDANEELVKTNAENVAIAERNAKALEDLAKAWRDRQRTDGARRRLGDGQRT